MRSMLLLTVMVMLFQFGSEREIVNHDIGLLMDAVEEENLELQSWEVVYLETMDDALFKKVKNELQIHHSVIIEQQDSIKKTIFSPQNDVKSLDYHITALDQEHGTGDIRVQIVIRGKSWELEDKAAFNNLTKRLQNKYAFRLERNFTCIKLLDNGIMNDGFSVNNLMRNLQVVHTMKHTDNMESSVYEEMHYGYSSLLSNELEVDETQINLHVAMRKMTNDKKQIIIGTPGILNEY